VELEKFVSSPRIVTVKKLRRLQIRKFIEHIVHVIEKEIDIYTDSVCVVKVNVIITKILIQDDSFGLGTNLIITNNAMMYRWESKLGNSV
jgi:hypothetical protein